MIVPQLRRFAAPLAIVVLGLGLSACTSHTTSDAATVSYKDSTGNHTVHITRADFKKQLGELVGSDQFQALLKSANFSLGGDSENTTSANLSATYLAQIVSQSAIDAEFAALKLNVTSAMRTEAVQQAKQEFALNSEIGQDPSTGQQTFTGTGVVYQSFPKSLQDVLVDRAARTIAVGEYYTSLTADKEQALYTEFEPNICPSGRLVSHILVKTEAEANTILDQLKAGASFANLAKSKSTDTTSGKAGGSVGCLRTGTFVKEFEDAAYAAPFDVPTGPVKTQFGYHVILVTHVTFADLKSELDTALKQNPLVARDLRLQGMKVWVSPQFGTGGLAVDSQRGTLIYQVKPPVVPDPRGVRDDDHDEHHVDDIDDPRGRVSRPRVVVVGLGPAGVDLLLPAARAALERIPVRYVRTARHPAVDELAREGLVLEPLDLLYDTGDDFDTVYAAIAARVVEAAQEHGEVAYAVPGSPSVAERTVVLLRGGGIDIEIVPGLSFADLAWNRLGIDPMTGARVVDARTFAVDSADFSGAMLLAQCDTRFVLSDVKLALLEVLPPEHEVIVLQGLGLPDEKLVPVALSQLDQSIEPDHLTSVFVDTGDVSVAGEMARLLALTERLRGPGGCPWDAAQTHHSLRRHVLEEAYEVAAAIDELPVDAPGGDIPAGAYDALEDELGDLLFQVMIHSVLAAEAGAFTITDVARGVHAKLVHRHPHVFGDVEVDSADAVVTNWEQIKKEEKGHASLVEGITPGLPSLIYVQKLLRKASSIGLTPELAVVDDHIDEAALGDALAALTAAGASAGIDGESALAAWAGRFKARFSRMESLAAGDGIDLAAADAATVRALWDRALIPEA